MNLALVCSNEERKKTQYYNVYSLVYIVMYTGININSFRSFLIKNTENHTSHYEYSVGSFIIFTPATAGFRRPRWWHCLLREMYGVANWTADLSKDYKSNPQAREVIYVSAFVFLVFPPLVSAGCDNDRWPLERTDLWAFCTRVGGGGGWIHWQVDYSHQVNRMERLRTTDCG